MTGSGNREPGSRSKLEQVVEGLLRAAGLLRVVRLADGRSGLSLPRGPTGEMPALVGHILRRYTRAELDRALEARRRIEIHALNAGTQIDLALRALAAR